MATWRLISWNDVPEWWSQELEVQVEMAATKTLPNETIGVFYTDSAESNSVRLHVFAGPASDRFIDADPNAVIAFCYEILASGAEVLGTFHTHPQGSKRFSERDQMLGFWGMTHLLLSHDRGLWKKYWAIRVRV